MSLFLELDSHVSPSVFIGVASSFLNSPRPHLVSFSFLFLAGTRTMHKLVLAAHALRNGTTVMDAIYVGECQDSSSFDQKLVQGKILLCSYTVRFILGVSTIKQALITAKNLTAAGLVFYMDSSATGFQMSSNPMDIPGILIYSSQDSQVSSES